AGMVALAQDDQLLAATNERIREALNQEYSAQLTAAMREELGVDRNETAVAAVRSRLTGQN
ncbi:MAG: hypothetical protein AAGK02_15900, partial [Pseudomonadota bacterium]